MVEIRKIKDLVTMPVIAAGAGVTVSLIGGEALGGVIAGIANVPETDKLKTAGVKALGKLLLGVAGAGIATATGNTFKHFGLGMAIGGIGGAIADIVTGGIAVTGHVGDIYTLTKSKVRPTIPIRSYGMGARTYATGVTLPSELVEVKTY